MNGRLVVVVGVEHWMVEGVKRVVRHVSLGVGVYGGARKVVSRWEQTRSGWDSCSGGHKRPWILSKIPGGRDALCI